MKLLIVRQNIPSTDLFMVKKRVKGRGKKFSLTSFRATRTEVPPILTKRSEATVS
jgi:hypothetical protein